MLETSPDTHVQVVAGGGPGDPYSVAELRAPAGAAHPPHVCAHEDGSLIVLAGELEVTLPAGTRALGPGDTLNVPRAAPRRMCVLADVRLLCISVPAGMERLADLLAPSGVDPDDRAALLAAAGVSLLPLGWGARPR